MGPGLESESALEEDKGFDKSQVAVLRCPRNFCLVAGAGSGKTKTLVEYILRFLAAEPTERSLSQILAITFTEKAATEMRERIGLALWQRLDQAIEADDLQARAFWEKEIRALGQAFVGTIHSYALSLVRDYAFYLRLPGDFDIDDSSFDEDLQEVVFDALGAREPWLMGLLSHARLQGGYGQASLARFLSVIASRLSSWGLSELLAPTSSAPPLEQLTQEFIKRQKALAAALERVPLPKLPQLKEAAEDKLILDLVALFQKNPDNLAADWAIFQAQIDDLLYRVGKSVAKANPPERQDFLAAAAQLFRYFSDQLSRPTLAILLDLSRELGGRLLAKRLGRGSLNFDDILIQARQLLRERPVAREREVGRWSLVVVDEFQDTNRLQADLLALILEPPSQERPLDRSNLVRSNLDWSNLDWASLPPKFRVFGDSKQSIYRFRGAESKIMSDLADLLPQKGGQTLELGFNYRTQPGLVGFFNDLFPQVLGKNYKEQRASRLELYPGPQVAWLTDDDYKPRATNRQLWKERQAQLLVAYLRSLFSGASPVRVAQDEAGPPESRLPTPGDVALLFRFRARAGLFEAALSAAGIPCHTMKGLSYFDYPEIRGLAAFYQYLAGLGLSYNLYAFLISPLGPVPPQTLEKLVWAEAKPVALEEYFTQERRPFPEGLDPEETLILSEVRELALALRPLALRRPPGEILETALERRDLLPLIVTGPGGSLERARLAQNFLGLVKSLATHDPHESQSPAEQVQALWLLESAQREQIDAQAETSPTAINIMTVHQAKGLEFPIVVIPEADLKKRSLGSGPLIDDEGHLGVSLDNLQGLREENWAYAEIKQALEAEDLLEHKRLLYVAATRARDHLVFLGMRPKGDEDNSWLGLLASSLAAGNKLAKYVQVINGLPEPTAATGAAPLASSAGEGATQPSPVEPVTRSAEPSSPDLSAFEPRLIAKLEPTQSLRVSVVKYCHLVAENEASEVEPAVASPEGPDASAVEGRGPIGPSGPTSARHRGILYHGLLEETDYNWDQAKFAAYLSVLAGRMGLRLSEAEATFLVERALAFQESLYGREAGAAWRAGRLLWRERSFWLRLDPEDTPLGRGPIILNGIMDLFYVREDGVGQVVDYKLARPGHLSVYERQVEIYKRAIREAGFQNEIQGVLWFAETAA
jgi:ATP-dependent helicase/nuclease subunit A